MSKQFPGVDIDAVHGGQMAETRILTFGEIINYRNHGDYPPLMNAAEFRKQICDLALKAFGTPPPYVPTRESVLEEAAKVCDVIANAKHGSLDWKKWDDVTAAECARRIRALISNSPTKGA